MEGCETTNFFYGALYKMSIQISEFCFFLVEIAVKFMREGNEEHEISLLFNVKIKTFNPK